MTANVYVGTSGLSVWFSNDDGDSWRRPYTESGLYLESRVWALACHPEAAGRVFAGTDSGLYRWEETERRWTHLPSPLDAFHVWSLAQAPHDPEVLVAGTMPAALFRTDDGGESWRRLPVEFARSCEFIGRPRVTQVLFDPDDGDTLWAGAEIDGVRVSRDGGETWELRNDGLVSADVHGLAVLGNGPRRVLATTNKGLHVSDDDGRRWRHLTLDSPWQYTRAVLPGPTGDGTVFLCNGNGPPGSTGRLLVSRDRGDSWDDAGLPGPLNSTPWCVAAHPAEPDLLFVATNLGQMYRSRDGGRGWEKLEREFGEVRAAAWQPA